MADVIACPNHDDLQRFLVGRMPEADAVRLQQHLAGCSQCVDTLHNLEARDTLEEAMRAQGHAAERSEERVVEGLVARLDGLALPAPSQAVETSSDGAPAVARVRREDCSFLAPPEEADELGRLGGYRILRILGAGGMGIVFEALDPRLKRHVALKVMKPALASSALARSRFLREAQSVAALAHDHIVAIHKVGEDRGVPFLAMPLLHGESLEDRLQRQESAGQSGALPIAQALRLGREIAEGLAAAHAARITHRDIKPANVWLELRHEPEAQARDAESRACASGSQPRVKLLDFGLARPDQDDAHLTQAGMVAGTPSYMAPEQAEGKPVDPRSDLFSLGAVLYRMATGQLPFRGASALAVLRALAVAEPPAPHKLNAELPAELSSLIMRLLAKKPEERPQSARQVVDALARLQHDLATKPAVPRRPYPRRRVALFAMLAGALLIALGLGALAYFQGPALEVVAVEEGPVPPFALPMRHDRPEQKFATLQEAVDGAEVRDVIEVRGDGPYAIPVIQLIGKALTIRAARGARPVFQPESPDMPRMFAFNGPLVLEGLEFRNNCPTAHATASWWAIQGQYGPVHIANCRFLVSQPRTTALLLLQRMALVELRNCELLCGRATYVGEWDEPDRGRLIVENNVFAGPGDQNRSLATVFSAPGLRRVSIRAEHNTMVGRTLSMKLRRAPESLELPDARIQIDTAFNVWDAPKGVFWLPPSPTSLDPKGKLLSAAEAEAILRGFVTWRERGNVLSETPVYCNVFGMDGKFGPVRSLTDWEQFWGQKDTGVQGALRYQGENLHARLDGQLETLTPQDFRLAAGSAGQGAGENGRDLGADVDLVGPGQAYERWKATPAYQKWLVATGQVPDPEPFVLLGTSDQSESTHASLAAAVAGAKDGDVVEVRGDGPFETPAIHFGKRALVIRAGVGFEPVLQIDAKGLAANLPLLTTNGPLVLEGLHFHHVEEAPLKENSYNFIVCQRAPLWVTHCRFFFKTNRNTAVLRPHTSPRVEVRHCVFGGACNTAISWGGLGSTNQLEVADCLSWGANTLVSYAHYPPEVPQNIVLRLQRNTFLGRTVVLHYYRQLTDPPLNADQRPFRIDARENIFDADVAFAFTLHPSAKFQPEVDQPLLPRWLAWTDSKNLYSGGLLKLGQDGGNHLDLLPSVADWQKYWGLKDTGSILEQPIYERDGLRAELRARRRSMPSPPVPKDFKLAADSPGTKWGEGGRNLGIRPGRVGPGRPYEIWRTTPEYAAWLKTTGQRL